MKPRKPASGGAEETQSPKPISPNPMTVDAMEKARRGELVTVGSVDELIAELNDDD